MARPLKRKVLALKAARTPGLPRGRPRRHQEPAADPSPDALNQRVRVHEACLGCPGDSATHAQAAPPKRPRRNKTEAVDQTHPPTELEERFLAIAELRATQAAAAAAGRRVSGKMVDRIARRIGICASHLRRLSHGCSFRSLMRRPGSGGPLRVTPAMKQWFRTTSDELGGFWTTRDMAAKMKAQWGVGSLGTVCRLARMLGFRFVRQRVCPLLTPEHKSARLEWAEAQLAQRPWLAEDTVYVHIDEKWFYAVLPNRKVWVAPNAKTPTITLASKSHIPKVMFLGAVAKPVPSRNFDGRIGLYPIADECRAQRSSRGRPAGSTVWKLKNMDTALFIELLKEKVVPDILRKTGSWAKNIVIQMDNAGGHGGGKGNIRTTTLAELNNWGEHLPHTLAQLCSGQPPTIKFIAQPPRSPDLNVLDLGIWTSLQVAVEKLRRTKGIAHPTTAEIVQCCQTAWTTWDATEKLNSIFGTLEMVLTQVREVHGGNHYVLMHENY